jgi:dinuclear metal center YbgI/SA1388 family protein
MSTLTVGELTSAIAAIAPFDAAAGWDPVGLQLGDRNELAATVAVCHEVTSPVVDAVLDRSVDTLVTYHPLLFHATRRLVAGQGASGRAHRLIRAGVNLVVVHTAFDVAPGGTADALAHALGLEEVSGFGPLWGPNVLRLVTYATSDQSPEVRAALATAGAGSLAGAAGCSFRSTGVAAATSVEETVERIEMLVDVGKLDAVVAALGAVSADPRPRYDVFEARGNAAYVGRVGALPAPLPITDFAASVGRRLMIAPRLAAGGVSLVDRVAVLPGSGGSMLDAAAATGADAFVTGDIAHHQARLANECGLAVVDAAHAPTERPGVGRLYAAVANVVDVAHDMTAIDASPWEAT